MGVTGRVGDRYRPLRLLGRGTFADVWLAADDGAPGGGPVVLKVFLPATRGAGPGTAAAGARDAWGPVRREVAAAARLGQAPGCVLAVDAVTTRGADGVVVPVLVLPYVPGDVLADWLLPRPAAGTGEGEVAARLRVLRGAVGALAATHTGGVAHGDVGFGNVLVDGRTLAAWLIDFGASTVADEPDRADADPHELRPIQPPPYGGPTTVLAEQRRDVYAVAVVATLALTGRHPLTDDWRSMRTGGWTGPADPHRSLPRRRVAALGPWVEREAAAAAALLDHCLSPRPEDRPTAAELLGAWPGGP